MNKVATLAAGLAFLATAAVASPRPHPAHHVPAKAHTAVKPSKVAAAPLVCPVTGEKIASIQASAGHSVYKGKTYYFCCGGCKPLFDKNPAKYIKQAKAPGKTAHHTM